MVSEVFIVNTKTKKSDLEKTLNNIIKQCLFAPRCDPSDEQLDAASGAYKCLKREELKIESEDDVISILSGNNVYEINYLE